MRSPLIAGDISFAFKGDLPSKQGYLVGPSAMQDDGIELCGLRIWGTPWQPYFFDSAFNAPKRGGEEFLAERFARIPDGTDVGPGAGATS